MTYAPDKIGFVALELDGPSQVQLEKALLEGFPGFGNIGKLLLELNKAPGEFLAAGLADTISAAVTAARSQGWDGNLILAARSVNPGNLKLQKIAAQFFASPVTVIKSPTSIEKVNYGQDAGFRSLERVVKDNLNFLNMESFLKDYTDISRRICKVEVAVGATQQAGTGFLVGPDVVLTNYHVVEDLLAAGGKAAAVLCRFDYLGASNALRGVGKALSTTAAFPLAWAKPSQVDTMVNAGGQLPDDGELDYALLQLATPVGDDKVLQDGTTRGFIRITDAPDPTASPAPFAADAPLVIVQHPSGQPMSLAIDTQGVIGLNDNGTRLRYRTNTEEGSSGSPCCTMNLTPIALHHAGDPKYAFRYKPQFNQGVPLHRIVAHLRKKFPEAADLLG